MVNENGWFKTTAIIQFFKSKQIFNLPKGKCGSTFQCISISPWSFFFASENCEKTACVNKNTIMKNN